MKKIMAGVLSASIAISPIISPVLAAEKDIMLISEQKTEEAYSMEKVLLAVKNRIIIPKELTEFDYRLSYSGGKSSGNKYWNFEWRDKENRKNLSIGADNSGNILSYSIYDRDSLNPKPTYLKEELVENAVNFINQVLPAVKDRFVLESSSFSGVYNGTYSYKFNRIENGVIMPDNSITVLVNYESGEIRSFNANWTFDVEIPSADVNISIEEAREKIGEKVTMNLKYMNKTEEINGKKIVKAYLVYVPDKSYMAVDAKTGEIYDSRDEFYEMSELENSSKMMMSAGAMNDMTAEDAGLTPEEISKIEEIKNLISKEDAISKVTSKKDVLFLDEAAKAVDARLTKKYNYNTDEGTGYIWNISFSDPRNVEYNSSDSYRAYTTVTVDANDGKILSFYSRVREYYDSKNKEWEDVAVKYTSEECRNTFEKLVKELEPEKFSNTKLSDEKNNAYLLKYINEEPIYGGYTYNYSRVNENIEYTYDRISGKVDGVTGKIYSYNVNWTDNIEFESPREAMSPEEAYKAYSEKEGFKMVYEINNKHYIENNPKEEDYYDYSDLYVLQKEVRLVYRTDINPFYISPFTGEQLDYSGNVYENINEKIYTDISGFWGEREIKLITDMGYTFTGDEFLPEKNITTEEWVKLLETVRSYSNKEDYEDLEKVTKLDAVKMIIKNLGFETVAKLPDIYKLSFNDENEVQKDSIGYVALAKGLGLINGDSNNNFNPNKELSRIEAVCMALKLANIR